jgi:hypothetical protein
VPLAAIGVDATGRLLRIFTFNRWVVGDDWTDVETTIAALGRFDMQMPRLSYLVNRWLTAVLVVHEADVAELVRERDRVLSAHMPPDGVAATEDPRLEVTSELRIAY